MEKKMIKCKACGAEIAKSAKRCPQCGARQHQVALSICAVLIVITIFACIGILFSNGGGDEAKLADSTPKGAPAEQARVFGVGDVVELKDIQVTLTSVEESSGAQFYNPSSGKTFLICHFNIENNSQKDIGVSSLLSFSAYVDEYATSLSLSATMSAGVPQLDGSVAAGKKMAGVIGYEVPEDWSELEIRFTPDFWSGNNIIFAASNGNK